MGWDETTADETICCHPPVRPVQVIKERNNEDEDDEDDDRGGKLQCNKRIVVFYHAVV